MTRDQAIKKLLAWLNQQVGYHEGANNWNKYAATAEMRRFIGWDAQNDLWCQILANAAYIDCFGLEKAAELLCTRVGAGTALCRAQADMFKAAGRWSVEPEPGDMVFFIVEGDINHVGIVEDVDGGYLTAVEGNSSDRVSRNRYRLNYPAIAGYGRPRWEVLTGQSDEPVAESAPSAMCCINIPMLRRGDKGESVKAAQRLLIGRGFSCGGHGVDGDFGPATEQAVRNMQTEKNLEIDGIVGPLTWAALLT